MSRGSLGLVALTLLLAAGGCTGDGPDQPGAPPTAPGSSPASSSPSPPTPRSAERPAPLSDLATGGPPRLAYAEGRTVVLPDGARLRTGPRPWIVQQGGLVAVATTRSHPLSARDTDRFRTRIEVVVDSDLVEITRDAEGPPVVSGDGRTMAWTGTGADGRAYVQRWQVGGSPGLRMRIDFRPVCCTNGFVLGGVDDAGTVYGTGSSTWAVPTSALVSPREVDVGGDVVLQVTGGGGLMAMSQRATVFGHLDGDELVATATLPGWAVASVSPQETAMVSLSETSVVMHDLREGQEATVLETGQEAVDILGWEDDDTVLLTLPGRRRDADGAKWVRCRTDGACELVEPR